MGGHCERPRTSGGEPCTHRYPDTATQTNHTPTLDWVLLDGFLFYFFFISFVTVFLFSLFWYHGTATWTSNYTPTVWAGLLQRVLFVMNFFVRNKEHWDWALCKEDGCYGIWIRIIQIGWLTTKRKTFKQNPDWPAGCKEDDGVGQCFCRESIFGWPFAQKRVCCQWCFGKESGSSGLTGLDQRRWFCTRFFLQKIFIVQMGWPVAKWMVLYKLFL